MIKTKEKVMRFVEELNEEQINFLDNFIKQNLKSFDSLQIENNQSFARNYGMSPQMAEKYKRDIGAY